MQRDGMRVDEVEARMKSQLPEEEKMKYADFVICNDNKHSLIHQVSEVVKRVGVHQV